LIFSLLAPVQRTLSRDVEALLLPDDQPRREALDARGAAEADLGNGLSTLELPDSTTTYYVINRQEVLRGRIAARFADVWAHDSDIAISSPPLYREFVHLKLSSAEPPEAVLLELDPALLFQVAEFVKSSPGASSGGAVAFREYRISLARCNGLAARVEALTAALRDTAGSIGRRPKDSGTVGAGELEEIIVDGKGYQLRYRFGRYLDGSVGVNQNDPQLFNPVDAVLQAILKCAERRESELRQAIF
jgi:hypothetical protein